jgi:hypothetical protein
MRRGTRVTMESRGKIKRGVLESHVRHTRRWRGYTMCYVLWDGNTRESLVPEYQLRIEVTP